MIVTVTHVDTNTGQSVTTATGTDVETGDTVTFGGDWRAMRGLAEALEDAGELDAEVEDWQILSTKLNWHVKEN